MFDVRMSILNHVNPLMSHVEMRTPLPAPNRIWWASTAEEWRRECTNSPIFMSDSSPTFADAVRSTLGGYENSTIDAEATLYILYGFWNIIWEHQQLHEMPNWEDCATIDSFAHHSSTLPATQRQPLLNGLKILRQKIDSISAENLPHRAHCKILLEYLSMVLLVPLHALHAFAGRDGESEARRMYPMLQEWVQTREARQAIWHAGQIHRSLNDNPSQSLKATCVTLLYQASITLWVYGVVMSARRSRDVSALQLAPDLNREDLVWLHGDADVAMRRFIATAEGVPALGSLEFDQWGGRQMCFVEDAKGTMELAVSLLKRPLGVGEGRLGIVESTTRLMSELARVAQMLEG